MTDIIDLKPLLQQSIGLIDEQLRLKHERDLERMKILKHMDSDNIHDLLWRLYVLLNEELAELEILCQAINRVNKHLAFSRLEKESGRAQHALHRIFEGLFEKLTEIKGFIRQQQRACNDLTNKSENIDKDELQTFSSHAYTQIISLMNKEIKATKDTIHHCNDVMPTLTDLEHTERATNTLELEGKQVALPGHELMIPLIKAIIHKFVSQSEFVEKYDVEMG